MALEKVVRPTVVLGSDSQDHARFCEECPTCGGQAYVRCGAVG